MVLRDIEDELVPFSLDHNISILAYSPMERGLLTGKIKPGHIFAEGDHRPGLYFFTEENIRRTNLFLEKIKPMAAEKNATLAQLVLRWTIEQPGITIALAGARNEQQAIENANAINIHLSTDELSFINHELSQLTLQHDPVQEPELEPH
jgi:aryl-alcohol dehydrogenase-like predicted oxidoreductase